MEIRLVGVNVSYNGIKAVDKEFNSIVKAREYIYHNNTIADILDFKTGNLIAVSRMINGRTKSHRGYLSTKSHDQLGYSEVSKNSSIMGYITNYWSIINSNGRLDATYSIEME